MSTFENEYNRIKRAKTRKWEKEGTSDINYWEVQGLNEIISLLLHDEDNSNISKLAQALATYDDQSIENSFEKKREFLKLIRKKSSSRLGHSFRAASFKHIEHLFKHHRNYSSAQFWELVEQLKNGELESERGKYSGGFLSLPTLDAPENYRIKSYQYIDLFDDELYDLDELEKWESPDYAINDRFHDQLNTIRYQIFLAILFNKTIVIPEQWAVSSATFVNVMGEVLDGYEGRSELLVPTENGGAQKRHLNLPFVISLMKRHNYISREAAYLTAFSHRLDEKRRVRLSAHLSGVTSNSQQSKANLSKLFQSIINNDGGQVKDWYGFQCKLEQQLQNEEIAINLKTLYRHITRFPDLVYEYEETQYRQRLDANVRKVKRAVTDSALVADVINEIEQFKDFFKKVDLEEIQYDKIMEMQELVRNYEPSARALIKKMGRFVMHNAMAENSGANYTTSFYSAFDPLSKVISTEQLENIIIKKIFEQPPLKKPSLLITQETDLALYAIKATAEVKDFSSLNWKVIWQSVWAFSVSKEWKRLESLVYQHLMKIDEELRHEHELWVEIFDTINTATEFFHMALCQQDPKSFIITVPVPLQEREFNNIDVKKAERKHLNSEKFTRFRGKLDILFRFARQSSNVNKNGADFEPESFKGRDYPT